MDDASVLLSQLVPDGIWGKTAFLAFCWYAAACAGHLLTAIVMLMRFSREGPVIPQLLPALQEKWNRAWLRVEVWVWFRRIGLAVLFLALVLAAASAGAFAYSMLSAPRVPGDWRIQLLEEAKPLVGIVTLFGLAVGVRVIVGGPASLVIERARNYVSASRSLVSSEDIARARRFIEDVERFSPEGQDDEGQPR